MREALEPRSGHAELLGARVGRQADDRMPRPASPRRAETFDDRAAALRGIRVERQPLLHPQLVGDVGARPPREDADARAERGDGVEVGEDRVPGGRLVHRLRDVVGRLDVELERGDHAERAEVHDGAGEVGVTAHERARLAVGGDESRCRARRSRASRCRRPTRACRWRRLRRPRCAAATRGSRARGRAAAAPARGRRSGAHRVNRTAPGALDTSISTGSRSVAIERAVGVGEVVERVAGAEHAERAVAGEHLPQLVDGCRVHDLLRPVGQVAGPVAFHHVSSPAQHGVTSAATGHPSASQPSGTSASWNCPFRSRS